MKYAMGIFLCFIFTALTDQYVFSADKENDERISSLKLQATQYEKQGDYQNAILMYTKIIELYPDNAEYYGNRAWVYLYLGKVDMAEKDLIMAHECELPESLYQNLLGGISYFKSDYITAESYFRHAIDLDKNNVEFYSNLWHTLFQLKRYEDSISYFEKAIELDPDNADYYTGLAWAYLNLSDYDMAKKSYTTAHEHGLPEDQYQNLVGNIYYTKPDYITAEDYFRRAIKLESNNAVYHSNLGNTLFQLERYGESIGCFKTATELDPENVIYHWSLGNVLVKERRYTEGIANLIKAKRLTVPQNR
jgi:tetratricopeptide (TPR) repeat protein